MLKYLIIQIADNSVSYCHYGKKKTEECRIIPIDILRDGIIFAMKYNLNIQYLLPPEKLPYEYRVVIDSYPHVKISEDSNDIEASVIVINNVDSLDRLRKKWSGERNIVLRLSCQEFIKDFERIKAAFADNLSLNIVFTDVDAFTDEHIQEYKECLSNLADLFYIKITKGKILHSNILTDRIALETMNNCGAGDSSIALAPNGKLYPCPAFYNDGDDFDYEVDLEFPEFENSRLFKLANAPLCNKCDAFHCKRCVWLNKKLTYEVNIPSHQQCVIAHIERNVSKRLLDKLKLNGILGNLEIKEIDFLDPFDNFLKP